MRSLPIVLVHCCVLTATLFCSIGKAQENSSRKSGENDSIRVSLGSVSGEPGESVIVPVYFTPNEGARVGKLSFRVTFVSANLKFDKVEPGIAAESGNVQLSHDLNVERNDKGVETSTMDLQFTAPDSAAAGIPSGLLAYIHLRINASGRPATITLRTTAEAAEVGTNRQLPLRLAPNATVEVIAPGSELPVVCFFFSH
jgi:Cohesin domain